MAIIILILACATVDILLHMLSEARYRASVIVRKLSLRLYWKLHHKRKFNKNGGWIV